MTTSTPARPTPSQLEAFAMTPKSRELAQKLVDQRKEAERLKKLIDETIYAPLMAEYAFTTEDGEVLTDSERLFIISDQDEKISEFYEDANSALLDAGYECAKEGKCPALVAGHKIIKIRWEIVDHWSQIFPDMTSDALCLSLKTLEDYMELIIKMTKVS